MVGRKHPKSSLLWAQSLWTVSGGYSDSSSNLMFPVPWGSLKSAAVWAKSSDPTSPRGGELGAAWFCVSWESSSLFDGEGLGSAGALSSSWILDINRTMEENVWARLHVKQPGQIWVCLTHPWFIHQWNNCFGGENRQFCWERQIKRFWNDCSEINAKVITATNHSRSKQRDEPIRYQSAGKTTRTRRIGLVLLPIGWKIGARFLNPSRSVAIEIASVLSTIIWKLLWKEVTGLTNGLSSPSPCPINLKIKNNKNTDIDNKYPELECNAMELK